MTLALNQSPGPRLVVRLIADGLRYVGPMRATKRGAASMGSSGSFARASGFHAGCDRKKNQRHPGGLLRAVSVPLTPGAVAKVSVVVALSRSHAGMVHNEALHLVPVDLCERISHRAARSHPRARH